MNWVLAFARGAIFLLAYVTVDLMFISATMDIKKWLFLLVIAMISGTLNQWTLSNMHKRGIKL